MHVHFEMSNSQLKSKVKEKIILKLRENTLYPFDKKSFLGTILNFHS